MMLIIHVDYMSVASYKNKVRRIENVEFYSVQLKETLVFSAVRL